MGSIQDAYGYAPAHLVFLASWSTGDGNEHAAFFDPGCDRVEVIYGPSGGINWGQTISGTYHPAARVADPAYRKASGLPDAVLSELERVRGSASSPV